MENTPNTTKSKLLSIKSFISKWLQDSRYYCNNCGEEWMPALHLHESCCENPQFGKNIDHCMGLLKQNKQTKVDQLKETGATADNAWRSAISLPPRLYADLEQFFGRYDEKLFNNNRELRAFMKEFPQFSTCRKI